MTDFLKFVKKKIGLYNKKRRKAKMKSERKEGICPLCGQEITAKLTEKEEGLLGLTVNYNKNCPKCKEIVSGIVSDLQNMLKGLAKEGVPFQATLEIK